MHSRVSGVSDFLAVNEHDAILKARQVVHNLHWRKKTELPRNHFSEHIEEPFYDPGTAHARTHDRAVQWRPTDSPDHNAHDPCRGDPGRGVSQHPHSV
jgi:hypothetical protein